MHGGMTQEQRLDWLVEEFKEDSGTYRDLETPEQADGKRQLLRSLMNIRMPRPMGEEVLRVQDAYLLGRAQEKGVVRLADIPVITKTPADSDLGGEISIWQGDITRLECDAIVNAANSRMLGCFQPCHSCIDNCIHTYAGIQLRQACEAEMQKLREKYGPDYEQPTAVPMITDAYNLPAKKVIHIVGPIVMGPLSREHERDLGECYRSTLEIVREHGLRSVAFCCISTGVFRFPNRRAAQIAADTVLRWLSENPGDIDRVIFNVFKDEDLQLYQELLEK
ncbi:MAG: protein-ADP-ribose hydrolase [Firmicutes bacterium]|nr:protein-ADP-ribose hydrolase [Bacillota bacterium]